MKTESSMKEKIVSDLHKILFATSMESDPDNWDLRVSMAKALLNHHHLLFRDNEEIDGSEYFGMDSEDHFFMRVSPGYTPSITSFEYICSLYFDLDTYEVLHSIGMAIPDLKPAIKKLRELSAPKNDLSKPVAPYRVVALATPYDFIHGSKPAA